MPRVLKHVLVALVVVLAIGCSGGGCTTCGGITPLAEGFDPNARIENAGSVRLTDSGVQFLQANLGTLAKGLLGAGMGALTFPIPETQGSQLGVSYDVCPGGGNPGGNPPSCLAEVDIGNAKINIAPQPSFDIHLTGTLPLRVQDVPVDISYFGIPDSADIVIDGNNDCPPNPGTFAQIPIDVDIAVHSDQNQQHSRYGYSMIEIVSLSVDKQTIKDSLHFCGGGFSNTVLGLLKGIVVDLVYPTLIDTVKKQIENQLCQKSNPALTPTCPNGTNDVNGICRYGTQDTDQCASIILGTDGHMNLGGFLASFAPGTQGGMDFLFAAGGPSKRDDNSGFSWGDLDPVGNGVTLGMFGGAEPNPITKCVKMSNITLPVGIPIPDELFANSVPNWPSGTPGPHVGIALSERFTNYALNSAYNSGVLCIGVSSEGIPLLNSGTLGLLAPSLKNLTIQQSGQQVALVIRPTQPPTIKFGNGTDIAKDPLLRVGLKQASFDFYVFSLDRFIRFMTATFDLDVPVNLDVTPMGLTPVIDKLGVTNGKVTNSSLLEEEPQKIADALAQLIAGQVGQALGGGLKPINLNSALASLGLELVIPDTVKGQGSPGLRKLSKGSDNYLGIFAALQVAGMPVLISNTNARLVKKFVDPAGLTLATIRPDNAPVVRVALGSSVDNSNAVEYQVKVDDGVWRPFTSERIVDVSDDYLRLQGRHTIHARSRIAGQTNSLDPATATVDFVIDAEPPAITIGSRQDDGTVRVTVKDRVSTPDEVQVRVRLDDGAWSEWSPASVLGAIKAPHAVTIDVEAKDEEGNIGTAQQALIRGQAPPGAMSSCGCSVPGGSETPRPFAGLVGIAIAGVLARMFGKRRQRKSGGLAKKIVAPIAIIGAAGSFAGCSCGETTQEATATASSGGCVAPMCVSLQYGLIGAYTSVAVAGDTLWFSGYGEADWDNQLSYGDLVVGKWNGMSVDWAAVDGVPTDPPVDPMSFDVNGFRGGQTSPGDDVGTWTSIAIDSSNNPAVAYYDRTHTSLRFAQMTTTGWSSHSVDLKMSADIGRYAKMLPLNGGFVIAYLDIEGGGDKGMLVSKVRIATTTNPTPGSSGDWTFEDAVVNKSTPCRAQFCSGGTVCVQTTKACTMPAPSGSCNPQCASGNACVDDMGKPSCVAVYDASKIDAYPAAAGDYIAIAPDNSGGFGLAFYDRINGNLVVASKQSGAWKTTVVDGFGVSGADCGIGASLFIDSNGDWHVAYVDGYAESVKYAKITGGKAGAPEVVDDGLSLGGMPFDDGQHIVGDDSSLFVTPSGEVHIAYQDATAGTLHYAVGTVGSGGHTWSVKSVDQKGFAGAFSHIISTGGQLQVANWWRTGGSTTRGDVAIVTP